MVWKWETKKGFCIFCFCSLGVCCSVGLDMIEAFVQVMEEGGGGGGGEGEVV